MDELKVTWILSNEIDYSFSIKQVYGFLFDNFGRILVHDDLGRFNLPGGKPEKDETVIQTLERECIEESQVTFKEPELIGFQLVENDKLQQSLNEDNLLARVINAFYLFHISPNNVD